MDNPAGEVTVLLQAWGAGDRSVEPRLFALVLPDLQRLARALMRKERPDHSLDPSALLNEAYCRLVAARQREWQGRRHFFAFAARLMRRMLVDHARGRPHNRLIPADEVQEWLEASGAQIELALEIDRLLEELEDSHPDWNSIVELKFFLGCTEQEIADDLGMPLRTVQRKYGEARRWLFAKLDPKATAGLRRDL